MGLSGLPGLGWLFPFPCQGSPESPIQYRINPRRDMPRHVLAKLMKTKHKGKNIKTAKEKQQITNKGIPKG